MLEVEGDAVAVAGAGDVDGFEIEFVAEHGNVDLEAFD